MLLKDVEMMQLRSVEYLPPEVLKHCDDRGRHVDSTKGLNTSSGILNENNDLLSKIYPWSIDVWSLGVVILEIITCLPVWMGAKCRSLHLNGRVHMNKGVFYVEHRTLKTIYQK